MSAKQLCDALAAAGFDGDDPLDPESLEWAFLQGEGSRRVFAWVCAHLRPGNVFSANDLELYEQLQMEGKLLVMNAILGKLTTTKELSYYHSEADIGVYLSYCDFQPYESSALACTKELNKWFSKKPLPFEAASCSSSSSSIGFAAFLRPAPASRPIPQKHIYYLASASLSRSFLLPTLLLTRTVPNPPSDTSAPALGQAAPRRGCHRRTPRPPLRPRISTSAWVASHRRDGDADIGFRPRLSSSTIPPGDWPAQRHCSLHCLPGAAALGRGSPGTGATRRRSSGRGSPGTGAPHAAAAWPGPNCRCPGVSTLLRRAAPRRVPPAVRLGCSGWLSPPTRPATATNACCRFWG